MSEPVITQIFFISEGAIVAFMTIQEENRGSINELNVPALFLVKTDWPKLLF